jgi:deoxyribonuclease V
VIACIDVHYLHTGGARAAVVAFASWDAAVPTEQHVVAVGRVEPYESGAFYKRELPCLLAALGSLSQTPDVVIVDGHAWLERTTTGQKPGLGARLLEAEPRIPTVVGVAKTRFAGAPAKPVFRGSSAMPLWVDEAGVFIDAPKRIAEMHGAHRVPAMLRLVDQLGRSDARARA